jgi:hypothetical protein
MLQRIIPVSAMTGHYRNAALSSYSIISSARASSIAGTSRPSRHCGK